MNIARRARALRRIFHQFQPVVIQSGKTLDEYQRKEREARTKAKSGKMACIAEHWERTAEFFAAEQEEETIFHDEVNGFLLDIEGDMKRTERYLNSQGIDFLAPRPPVHPMCAYDEPIDVVERKFARLEALEKEKEMKKD
jgi:hypothetical protein